MTLTPNHTVLIIADDLTGAADSTTGFARQGFRTRVIVDAVDWSPADIADYDVVAFNTETRNLTSEESVAIVAPLARRLAELKPRLILKKVDSTFRGNVLAETATVLEELGLERTVIVSAHPLQKRVVSRGAVFVDGIPLQDTTFARHPAPPPPNIPSAIRETFDGALVFSGLSTRHLPEKPPAGVYLPDASKDEDLTRVARWVVAQKDTILPAGSAALAHAFARFMVPPFKAKTKTQSPSVNGSEKILFVVGSTQAQTGGQIQMLTSTRTDVTVIDAANGILSDADIQTLTSPVVVLRIVRGTKQITHNEAAENLAHITRKIMDTFNVSHLITVGGNTSSSVIRKLEITGFDIAQSSVADLPRGEAIYKNNPLTFVAKPGGFNKPTIFASLADQLLPRTTD